MEHEQSPTCKAIEVFLQVDWRQDQTGQDLESWRSMVLSWHRTREMGSLLTKRQMERSGLIRVPGEDKSSIKWSSFPIYTVGYSRSLYKTFMPLRYLLLSRLMQHASASRRTSWAQKTQR